jgi:hypothetical protein
MLGHHPLRGHSVANVTGKKRKIGPEATSLLVVLKWPKLTAA